MAECKSCGKTYFSKSCPHCNAELRDSVLGKTKKKSFLALIITLLIISSIGIMSYLIAEVMMNNKTLETAKAEARVEKLNRARLQKEQKRLARQQKSNYQPRYRSSSTTYRPKEKSYRHVSIEKEIVRQSYQPKTPQKIVRQERTSTPTYTSKTSQKIYPKYSTAVKLKSDSKITILSDNRLTSNAPIYGTYNGDLILAPACKKREIRDIHLVNDCYVRTISGMDKLYIKKSWVKEFRNYNKMRNKKIECDYSKKHGIMHDCKIWNG